MRVGCFIFIPLPRRVSSGMAFATFAQAPKSRSSRPRRSWKHCKDSRPTEQHAMSNHRFVSAAVLPSIVFVAACGRVEPDVGLPDVANSDWPSYNSTVSGTRYSMLNEINTGTVTQLRQV